MTVLVCILLLLLAYLVWQSVELKKFKVTEYRCVSNKIKQEQRFAVLADLHGFCYGKGNERLLDQVRVSRPDFILIAGDMIVSREPETYGTALETLEGLVKIAPVYYGFGNHESRAAEKGLAVSGAFAEYLRKAEKMGVRFLRNESISLVHGLDTIKISGLELPKDYYEKGREVSMKENCVETLLGGAEQGQLQLLLAHNPAYSRQYAAWGADLTLCGHNHGGLIRFPWGGSLLSPQLTFFPEYDSGCHEIEGKKVIISRGLGTHTYHIRIFNRAELVMVELLPAEDR